MNKVLSALLAGFILTVLISNYSDSVQADLASNLIRFHVVANSDSAEDQALKLKVRDRIINELKELFDNTDNINATKEQLQNQLDFVEEIARDEIKKSGKDYPVKAELGVFPFPTKVYGDVTLPAGHYEALRVVIGEGAGKNWWCVLFPPLCFVDATHGELPESSKEQLKNMLTEEEYKIITSADSDSELPVQIKFKIVEWWQNSKLKIQTAFNRTD